MNLNDEGIIISLKKFSDSASLMKVLTKNHGIYSGLIRLSKKNGNMGVNVPGNVINITWRARLSEHLGFFNSELIKSRSSLYLNSSINLEILNSLCALLDIFPEREECEEIYLLANELFNNLNDIFIWPILYIKFELLFIEKMGYGLDLDSCAVNGSNKNLSWVSPKSGRAVSNEGAIGWEDRLLRLPNFFKKIDNITSKEDLIDGLKLTEFFLNKRVYSQQAKNLPSSRIRLVEYIKNNSVING